MGAVILMKSRSESTGRDYDDCIFMERLALSFWRGLKAQCYLTVPRDGTRVILTLYCINRVVFVIETECVYCEVGIVSCMYYLQESRVQGVVMTFLVLNNGIFQ